MEAMWATSSDPKDMLTFLPLPARDPRKARRVAVAACRRFPPPDPRSLAALEVAERFMHGRAGDAELAAAADAAGEVCRAIWPHAHTPESRRVARARSVAEAFQRAAAPDDWFFAEIDFVGCGLLYLLRLLVHWAEDDEAEAECRAQAESLRAVFGNPFGAGRARRTRRGT